MDLVQVLPNALKCPCVSIKHALKKQGIKTLKPLISQGFQVSVSILVTQDGCGGRTRTYGLRVMSPTSYQLLYSAIYCCTGGAGDRTRTGTALLPGDFKSPVSTIPPHRRIRHKLEYHNPRKVSTPFQKTFDKTFRQHPRIPRPTGFSRRRENNPWVFRRFRV